MRHRWTDDRMDDLNTKVDELGRRMDNGFNRLDADVRVLRQEMEVRFQHVDSRLDTISRALVYGVVALSSSMLTGFVAIAVAIVTQS